MTEVAFHLNVPDAHAYACRLLRKAYLKGAEVRVMADQADVDTLDRDLWMLAQSDFVPHATQRSAPHVLRHSPILIQSGQAEAGEVLLNLSSEMPKKADAFARVIEIVKADEDSRRRARQRWKLYRDSGLSPVAIDLAAPSTG